VAVFVIASITVPIVEAPLTPIINGDIQRAFNGTARGTYIGTKRSWQVATEKLSASARTTLRAAIDGLPTVTASGDVIGGSVSVIPRVVSETPVGTSPITYRLVLDLQEV